MNRLLRDPLLAAASLLLLVLLAGSLLALLANSLGLLITTGARQFGPLAHGSVDAWRSLGAPILGLTTVALVAALAWHAIGLVRAIGSAHPFHDRSVEGLQRVATLAVALQIVGLLGAVLDLPVGGDINGFAVGGAPSANGLLLTLLLFVLARAFRRGAALHRDVEATI